MKSNPVKSREATARGDDYGPGIGHELITDHRTDNHGGIRPGTDMDMREGLPDQCTSY